MRLALVLLAACGAGSTPAVLSHREQPVLAVDTDGDGIIDGDGCPTVAEDFDLFADSDGCPDLDDDHDGVPDLQDSCFDTPGTTDSGCPEGCTIVTDITDCFFITPIWTAAMTPVQLAEIKTVFDEFPEIVTVTLTTYARAGEAPVVAQQRLERARRALIAVGVPGSKLAIHREVVERDGPPDVFGMITKQRFDSGKFRTSHCAGGMGTVYRVAREKNYSCKPPICGDGRCWDDTEDAGRCPQDCPP